MNQTDAERLRELEEENRVLRAELDRREHVIRRTMSRYLTDEVLEEVLRQQDDLQIGGERRTVTIMFTDLRRSTELAESMNPTDFIRMLNHYLGEMIEIINAWQGNILSFVGDAIVVVFGAPRTNPDAARDAVASAVNMQRRMEAVNSWNAEQGYPAIAMGIGIHTGEAILGNIGSETRVKYDMIGRNVNLASRVEGFTRGGEILITSDTLRGAGELVRLDKSGERTVRPKGFQEDILLHRVVGFASHSLLCTSDA